MKLPSCLWPQWIDLQSNLTKNIPRCLWSQWI